MRTFNIDAKMRNIIKSQILDEQSIIEYVYREIEKKHYSKYLNNIIITDEQTLFEHYYKELFINLKGLLEEGDELFSRSYLTSDRDIFINLWMLFLIIHEMEHIKQNSFFFGNVHNYMEDYIAKEIHFSTKQISDAEYDRFHDYFLYERLATFSSFGSIFDLFSKEDLNIELYDCFVQYMLYYLKAGYTIDNNTIKSPIETVFELMKINKSEIANISEGKKIQTLTRVEYGLPIKLEHYNKLKYRVGNRYRLTK